MVTDDILSFKDWWLPFYKKTTRVIPKEKRVAFNISTYKEFSYSNQKKGKIGTNSFLNGLAENTFSFAETTCDPSLPRLTKAETYTVGYEWFNRTKFLVAQLAHVVFLWCILAQ
ncbi:hypothetical protein C0J52_20661 [Blattella germanica]|nr:hypothetical protein C0J52_20661 [Blattella germanica]